MTIESPERKKIVAVKLNLPYFNEDESCRILNELKRHVHENYDDAKYPIKFYGAFDELTSVLKIVHSILQRESEIYAEPRICLHRSCSRDINSHMQNLTVTVYDRQNKENGLNKISWVRNRSNIYTSFNSIASELSSFLSECPEIITSGGEAPFEIYNAQEI